jgi:hypothetical protein
MPLPETAAMTISLARADGSTVEIWRLSRYLLVAISSEHRGGCAGGFSVMAVLVTAMTTEVRNAIGNGRTNSYRYKRRKSPSARRQDPAVAAVEGILGS